jgi:hypothetical protein
MATTAPLVLALLASFTAVSCESRGTAPLHADDSPTSANQPSAASLKTLTLQYTDAKPVVGTRVAATADGLAPGRTVDLVWATVDGGWIVENGYQFRGKRYDETTLPLGQSRIGADGRLSATFIIPEDYGGVHEVKVVDAGVVVAQGGIEVSQTFDMHPKEGPVGTAIELRVKGLGWRTMESTWVINWDNREVGWVSAAGTRGSAVARFRAAGPAGRHDVKVYTGYMGQPYLNYEQAPNAYLPRPEFVFNVTPGNAAAPTAYAEPYQQQPVPPDESIGGGARVIMTPKQGPVLTAAKLEAAGLPPGSTVSLMWGTQAGSRVTDAGFAPQEIELAKLEVDASGRLAARVTIPDDLGGLHTLTLKAGDKPLARTFFVVETSIVSISPTSGPPGTPVTIHLKGVGWTDYDNIYVLTYDNAYMGYACGFNSQGDVVVNFTASGSPGVHLIDFYPGIYQGPGAGQQLYRLPQLTYADDHPGNKIPALRFAFEITPPPRNTAPPRTTSG